MKTKAADPSIYEVCCGGFNSLALSFQTLCEDNDALQEKVEMKQKSRGLSHPVSGEVVAKNEPLVVAGFVGAQELSKRGGIDKQKIKMLATGVEETSLIEPVKSLGHVIKIYLTHGKNFLGRSGTISIQTMDGKLYAEGATVSDYMRPISQACFCLKDRNQHPVALCMQDRIGSTYTLYGTTPLHPNDKWETKQGDTKMYPWFRVNRRGGKDRKVTCDVKSPEGEKKKYKPYLIAKHATTKLNDFSDEVCVRKGEYIIAGDADAYNMREPPNHALLTGKTTKSGQVSWNLTIAPGADPALMICFSALVADFFGSFSS
mmetsp:Transcript_6884/g.14039  ORF Transcript_6884/g.14039 Transcript_6884/m.14039 type:complete len:317 (+) Transcript_6884:243-1193(+)